VKGNIIKAIAFDMDGTLLTDSKEISKRTRRCFEALEEKGISLILSTGRSYEALEPYKRDLNLRHPVICYNGARVLGKKGEVIKEHQLSDDISKFLINFGRNEGVHIQVYRDGKLYFEKRTPEAEFYESHVNLKGEIVNFDNFYPLNFTKIMFLGEHSFLAGLIPEIEESNGKRLAIMFSTSIFLEFMDGAVSKGNALFEVADHLNIAIDNIMSFGDGENDISMIKTAGIGVAMENAAPNVKAVADEVTLSNNDDGVAEFLEDFFKLKL
jgi:Cof subfamily protein (haloacid dehalogenase superfamily)